MSPAWLGELPDPQEPLSFLGVGASSWQGNPVDPGRLQICPELPTGSCSRLGLAACSVASRSKGHLQSNTDHEVVPPAESRLGTEEGVFGVFPRRCGPVSLDLESQPIHVCPYHSPRHTATGNPPQGGESGQQRWTQRGRQGPRPPANLAVGTPGGWPGRAGSVGAVTKQDLGSRS